VVETTDPVAAAVPVSFGVRWVEDVRGTWLYHCHVESHMRQGMIRIYQVR
jgi:FtsP/CotA-like multicopper oxidase with cupredoxin domain